MAPFRARSAIENMCKEQQPLPSSLSVITPTDSTYTRHEMSASSSVLISSRKGRHTRSKGATLSSSSFNDSVTVSSGSQSALPANVDVLTLDPDEAFIRFSVRDIQTIEATLQSTHDGLSSNLRSLVSEKYRDMLGTANTLIEMSSSASNLVNRLDAVREGVEKARVQKDGKTPDRHFELSSKANGQANEQKRSDFGLHAIAAATKLLAEAPDDVWRAIDTASLDSTPSVPTKRALVGRELHNFKAATALRAAWIYILCQEAWKWLSEEKHEVDSDQDTDVESLFPYISKQWLALNSMKTNIVNVSHAGLEGWFASDANRKNRWEDVSTSYTATITFLLSAALLESLSIRSSRDLLLRQRRKAIEERLQHGMLSPSTTLIRMVRGMAEIMVYSLRAFVSLEEGSRLPHLASVFESMSRQSALGGDSEFPPGAFETLSTLPSASVFVKCLPAKVRRFEPQLQYQDAEECRQTTVKVIQDWSTSIRKEQEASLTRLVERLKTISSIGEAQIQLRESLDRCCSLAAKLCPQEDSSMRVMVEEEVKALVMLLEGLLLHRLDVICQERTAELPAAVSNSISAALKLLSSCGSGSAPQREQHVITLERNPTKFLFDPDLSTPSLETKIRIQTPLVKRVLLAVEEHATSLSEEMEAYAAYVQKDARKSAKRKQKSRKHAPLADGHDGQMDRVLCSYHSAFDSARLALTDELDNKLKQVIESGEEGDKRTQLLYLVRIASGFQHSTVLQSNNSMTAKGSNDDFAERLGNSRKDVLNNLIEEIIKEAVSSYSTRIKVCLDPRVDQLGRPTSAFINCVMQVVDGIQSVGCGYQSEISALGKDFLSAFANSWLNLVTGLNEQECFSYTFDSYALSVLLQDHAGSEGLNTKLKKLCSNLDDKTKDQIETALQRLRLILIPLLPHEAQLLIPKKSPAGGFTSAPPLPMLSIIEGRERVALLL